MCRLRCTDPQQCFYRWNIKSVFISVIPKAKSIVWWCVAWILDTRGIVVCQKKYNNTVSTTIIVYNSTILIHYVEEEEKKQQLLFVIYYILYIIVYNNWKNNE